MYLHDTEVEILVNGKPVKKYSHDGSTYVQANKGSNYSIKVRNSSPNRRLFVVSVDGINVVDGESAGSTEMGYVINGYSSYEIKGFRTSNEEVHPFKFNDKEKSYAAKSDAAGVDVKNCGVIGVQVYDEKVVSKPIVIEKHIHHHHTEYVPAPYNPPYTWGDTLPNSQPTIYRMTDNTAVPQATFTCSSDGLGKGMNSGPIMRSVSNLENAQARRINIDNTIQCLNFCQVDYNNVQPLPEEKLSFSAGTEFSKQSVQDVVSEVQFEIGRLLTTIEIFYAYRQDLIDMGVPVISKHALVNVRPQAFPSKFCKPPKS